MSNAPAIPRDEELSGNVVPPEERGADYYGPAKDDLLKVLEGLDLQPADDTTSTAAAQQQHQAPPPPPPAQEARPAAERAAPPPKVAAPAAPAAATEPPAEQAPAPNPFAQLLKAREETHRAREAKNPEAEAQRFVEEARKRAQEEADRILRDARERAEREAHEHVERFKRSPLETIRAANWKGEDVVEATRAASSKEWQIAQQALEAAGKTSKEIADFKNEWNTEREQRKREAEDYQRYQKEDSDRAFLRDFASPTKCPQVYAALEESGMDGDEVRQSLLQRAYKIDDAVAQAAQSGIASDPAVRELVQLRASDRVAYFSQLATFLESGAAERRGKRQEPGAPATQAAPPAATKRTAPNGSRTLSASSASEHRAGPKPFHEMTADEQRADLIREQQAAIAALNRGQSGR